LSWRATHSGETEPQPVDVNAAVAGGAAKRC